MNSISDNERRHSASPEIFRFSGWIPGLPVVPYRKTNLEISYCLAYFFACQYSKRIYFFPHNLLVYLHITQSVAHNTKLASPNPR